MYHPSFVVHQTSIHFLLLIQYRVTVRLEPVPAVVGQEARYGSDRLPICCCFFLHCKFKKMFFCLTVFPFLPSFEAFAVVQNALKICIIKKPLVQVIFCLKAHEELMCVMFRI